MLKMVNMEKGSRLIAKTTRETSFCVESDGVRLQGTMRRARGTKYGSIVFVHGLTTDGIFFDACAERLGLLFDVVQYDRRGYGRSGDPSDSDFTPEAQPRDLMRVLALVESPKFVIAHSAGGIVALDCLARYQGCIDYLFAYEPPIGECLFDDPHPRLDLLEVRSHILENGIKGVPAKLIFGPRDNRSAAVKREDCSVVARNRRVGTGQDAAALIPYKPLFDRLTPSSLSIGIGELSRGLLMESMGASLAQRVGCPLYHFPGSHNCPADLPDDFANMAAGIILQWCAKNA